MDLNLKKRCNLVDYISLILRDHLTEARSLRETYNGLNAIQVYRYSDK